MADKIVYRGLTAEQAVAMSNDQFVKSLNSRERRSVHRNSYKYSALLEKVALYKSKKADKMIKTHLREAVIRNDWVGLKFGVHNGKEFQTVVIEATMIGHRLGEFAYSTKRVVHSAPGIKATKGSRALGEK
jgi:small subunit ribosomal protein S19